MRWKLWYGPDDTFSSDDGSWTDAPALGVLLLVTEDPDVGREFSHGAYGDFYGWWPGASRPWGLDRVGVLDLLQALGHPTSLRIADLSIDDWIANGIKLGRSVESRLYRDTLLAADQDPSFPPKSALTVLEAMT